MKKKTIALLLTLCMLTTVLAGCNNNPSDETPSGTTPDPSTSVSAPNPSASVSAPISAPDPSVLRPVDGKPFANGETITIGLLQLPFIEDYKNNAFTLWLEEQTGLNLEFVLFSPDAGEARTQLSLMMTSGETLPDVIWRFGTLEFEVLNQYGNDGYIIDLLPYINEYGYYFWETWNMMDADPQQNIINYGIDPVSGAYYGMPEYSEVTGDAMTYMTYINQQWLDALNLKMPTTTEELYNVLVAFRDGDPNGNGVHDEIPMLGLTPGSYRSDITGALLNSFVYLNDEYFFNATNGKLWAPYTTDAYREGLRYMNRLVEDGLLSQLTWTMQGDELKSIITHDSEVATVGVLCLHASSWVEEVPYFLDFTGLNGISSDIAPGYVPLMDDTYRYNSFITADCKNPEYAFRMLDRIFSKEGALRLRYGEPGVDIEWAAPGTPSNVAGVDATLVVKNNIWGAQHRQSWNDLGSTATLYRKWKPAWEDNGSWSSTRTKITGIKQAAYREQASKNNPSEIVYNIMYTSEENIALADIKATVKGYIYEARAGFATGLLDIDI